MHTGYQEFIQIFSGHALVGAAAFLIVLIFAVAIHEFGHLIAARLCGVRIDKISLGFGKEIAGYTNKSGIRWSLSRVPLGGYIQLFGDVDPARPEILDPQTGHRRSMTPEEWKQAFIGKRVWQRMVIVLAGPVFNFILAFFILLTLFMVKGQVASFPIVTAIGVHTAADEAGFHVRDKILAVNGTAVRRFEDVWQFTKANENVPYIFTIQRGGEILKLKAAARHTEYRDENGIFRAHGRLGATDITALKLADVWSVNGENVRDRPERARKLLRSHIGNQILLGMSMGPDEPEEQFRVMIPAASNKDLSLPGAKDYDKVYLAPDKKVFYYKFELIDAAKAAVLQTGESLMEGVRMLGVLFTGHARKPVLGGIATLSDHAGRAAQEGLYTFFVFLAVFSIQIGFINLFPIPALDGGYLLFLAYEALTGRALAAFVRDTALYLGLAFIFGIMIIANLSDFF